jgi:hypothetical protein
MGQLFCGSLEAAAVQAEQAVQVPALSAVRSATSHAQTASLSPHRLSCADLHFVGSETRQMHAVINTLPALHSASKQTCP